MTDRQILVASNRGPASFVEKDGELVARRGAGGLVSALTGVVQETGGVWVAAAMGAADRRKAESVPNGRMDVVVDDAKYRLRLLSFDPVAYDHAYNTISNRMLWFLHHYLWDVACEPWFDTGSPEAWGHYRDVNEAFATALAEEAAGGEAAVLVQDYHLSLVPARLRELAPQVRITHFHHCPFAGPEYLRLLPWWIRAELLAGLLGADVLGFQTARWAESFLLGCRLLEGARVDVRRRTVDWQGRRVRVRVYPISIDAASLRQTAAGPGVRRHRRELAAWRGDRKLLLRVDRAELSKNVLRGFLAYSDFLRRYPEWHGRIVFLALLNPSRGTIPEYRAYAGQSLELAEHINDEFGTPDWDPILLDIADNFERVLAAFGLYDLLLVNPVFDGMNLVAKEGPLLNRNQGVLLLSKNAGAFAELGSHALALDPLDVAGTADALVQGLEMAEEERARRARALRRVAAATTPAEWVGRQVEDLSF